MTKTASLEAFPANKILVRQMNEAPHPWGWTSERRARQAAAIHGWRPWDSATGPTTLLGKSIVSRNANRPESVRRQLKEITAELKRVNLLVKEVAAKRGKVPTT